MTDRIEALKNGILELIDDIRIARDIPVNPQHAYLRGGIDALTNYGILTDEECSILSKLLEDHYM